MGEAKNGPDRMSGWLCWTLSLVGVVGGKLPVYRIQFSIQMAYLIPCMCFLVPGVIMLPFCSDLSS